MARLTVRSDVPKTWLKALPKQAGELDPRGKVPMVAGQQLAVLDNNIFDNGDGHLKLVFSPPLTIGYKDEKVIWKEGYIYGSHWEGISAIQKAKTEAATRFSSAGSSIVLQPTPLFVQNDNASYGRFYGGNLCGQTSLAMLLATIWPNAKVKQLAASAEGGQFENWLGTIFQKIGAESTAMEGHVAVLKELGIKAKATRSASIADLKQALHGHPVVLGLAYNPNGPVPAAGGGHFVCASGVADKAGDLPEKWPVGKIDTLIPYPQDADRPGVLVNDPYGEREYSGSGNQWVNIARKIHDTFGLHNVLGTDVLNRFWVDGGEESGWAVMVDPSTPNAGNDAEKPIVLATPNATPATPQTIEIISDTLLKHEPIAGASLDSSKKTLIKTGTKLTCEVIGSQSGHARVKMPDGAIRYIFNQHFKGQEKAAPPQPTNKLDVDRPTLKKAIEAVAAKAIPDPEINQIVDAIIAECPKFGVTTKFRLAMFIGQCAHETGEFLYTEEIGDAAYFTDNYEGRSDLGNTQPGDGAKFPGFGWIQLTGRNNVTRFSKAIGRPDLIDDPTPIGQYPLCVTSALFWWQDNRMNPEADQGLSVENIKYCTKIINGGYNGLDHRIQLVSAIKKIFGA